mmetsp:Transcript_20012/g.47949  ORF Transcript_20012/g.47949 Transcript_20012/m.47949 type:complete len:474 (-) Transcript_20012:153-1574(-)
MQAEPLPSSIHELLMAVDLAGCTTLLHGLDLKAAEGWCARDRVGFLSELKRRGVANLKFRQTIANAVSRNGRRREEYHALAAEDVAAPGSGPVLQPEDPRLLFSRWNWAVRSTAISNQPGAYFKCSWRGLLDTVVLTVDSSASSQPFMNLSYAFDEQPCCVVTVPHGSRSAEVQLVPTQTCAKTEDSVSKETDTHSIVVHILASVQQFDRWGSDGKLPPNTLRLASVQLPYGADAQLPKALKYSMVAFGCSITEGVCARFKPGSKASDLNSNSSTSAWHVATAEALNAEYSSVGFGRQGWTIDGNGNVPPFTSSWRFLWAGMPRVFRSHTAEPPDFVLINHGCNDGLNGALPGVVSRAVVSSLRAMRTECGPQTHIFLVVPFGGWCASSAPEGALATAYQEYQALQPDPKLQLIDLGPGAAHNLAGFRTERGRYVMSRESIDGVHPTAERHRELGALVAEYISRAIAFGTAAS